VDLGLFVFIFGSVRDILYFCLDFGSCLIRRYSIRVVSLVSWMVGFVVAPCMYVAYGLFSRSRYRIHSVMQYFLVLYSYPCITYHCL
jgi:hypothetical protein